MEPPCKPARRDSGSATVIQVQIESNFSIFNTQINLYVINQEKEEQNSIPTSKCKYIYTYCSPHQSREASIPTDLALHAHLFQEHSFILI